MDIYKLVITNLKSGVKNPERVNVYVNNEYAFSLSVAQVVDLGVKVGKIIDDSELAQLKQESEFGKIYQRALEWVLTRPRSEKETREYLKNKLRQPSSGFIDDTIEKFYSRGYLDDQKFAEWYVENRFVKKGVSAKRLRMELMKKGVAKDIIETILEESERSDEDEIRKMITKKRAKYTDEKLIQYLCRQGFPYELVRELVLTSGMD